MSNIRTKLSVKNPYFIDKYRYLELKNFCLQYKAWKKMYKDIDGSPNQIFSEVKNSKNISDPIFKAVEKREEYLHKMELVENSAKESDPELYGYLIHGVTEGVSYYGLRLYYDMPACKDKYYKAYRRFFFILDKSRK